MRRVRLEKLCVTKNSQAESNSRRSAPGALGLGPWQVFAASFDLGDLGQDIRGSIEHVV